MIYCMALDKVAVGRRQLWMVCRQDRGHDGLHYDEKHHRYWHETFFAFEFEYSKAKNLPATKKTILCSKCGKRLKALGAVDADRICVCKEIGATRRQSIMFADEREQQHRTETMREMDEDIAWVMEKHAAMIEERCEFYGGEF